MLVRQFNYLRLKIKECNKITPVKKESPVDPYNSNNLTGNPRSLTKEKIGPPNDLFSYLFLLLVKDFWLKILSFIYDALNRLSPLILDTKTDL